MKTTLYILSHPPGCGWEVATPRSTTVPSLPMPRRRGPARPPRCALSRGLAGRLLDQKASINWGCFKVLQSHSKSSKSSSPLLPPLHTISILFSNIVQKSRHIMSLSPRLRLPRRPAPNEKNTAGQSRQILEGTTLLYAKQTYSFFTII